MLIFEGPDNSGKSTISAYLSYELGIPLHHFGKPPKNIKELEGRIAFMFDNYDKYIFDRVPLISEQVYSILRSKNLMSMVDEPSWHYRRLRSLDPLIIYCRPSNATLINIEHQRKKYDSETHLREVEKNKLGLIERYDQVMSSEYLPPNWLFDYTKQEHDLFLRDVEDELIRRGHYLTFLTKYRQMELPL